MQSEERKPAPWALCYLSGRESWMWQVQSLPPEPVPGASPGENGMDAIISATGKGKQGGRGRTWQIWTREVKQTQTKM